MRKILFSLMGLWLAMATLFAQNEGENTESEAEENINVIAYFAKNDTMRYRSTEIEEKIVDGDTTVVHNIVEDFMLVVTDSTSEGYRLEMSMQDHAIEDGNDFASMLAEPLWELTKDVKCTFTIDEMGSIQHIENWREIRDVLQKGITLVFDTLYGKAPGLDSIMPRRQTESLLLMQYATEAGVLTGYNELGLLFAMHGNAVAMGENTFNGSSEAGYPTETWINAGYTKQTDEYDMEGDYGIFATTTTTIPTDDAIQIAKNAMGLVMTDKVNATMEEQGVMEELRKQMADDMKTVMDEIYLYFYNGWPKSCSQLQTIRMGKQEKRTYKEVEWLSRKW